MGICSVVITIDEADPRSRELLARLAQDECWTLGDPTGMAVPAVLETESTGEDRRCLNWLDEQPGVVGVQLIFAHYDGGQDVAAPDEDES